MQPYDDQDMQGVDLPIPNDPSNTQSVEIELARAASGVASRTSRPMPLPVREEGIRNESEGWLTIDVYQTPHEIVVESAVAGVDPDALDITATPDSLAIKGERQRRKEVRDDDYLYQECYWGKFSRSVILPQEVDPENATVSFKNGILTVRLPKVNRKKTHKLKVSSD
jgi:HSP20 family protein